MAEPCSPKTSNTEEKGRENSSDVEALLRWTSFEEVEDIIIPYISQATHKAVYGGYKSAREVYVDYKIFNHAYTQLVTGKDKLVLGRYAHECFYHYALTKKKEMLCRFATMLSYASLKEIDKQWIIIQLLEDNKSEHQVLDTVMFNDYWDAKLLRKVDKDVESELIRQKEEKLALLGTIHHNQNEFQADNFLERKEEFEELKCHISCADNYTKLLVERGATYYQTLGELEDGRKSSMLAMAFQTLLRKDEKDLSRMWSEETVRTVNLVAKEKEKSDKAKRICDANWNKVVASSGLL